MLLELNNIVYFPSCSLSGSEQQFNTYTYDLKARAVVHITSSGEEIKIKL